ncbi:MAG TPA: hypothetical protein VNY73_04005 [Bacteroidia bacterium]|jgi:hypothetical protein|nr:hypothetical protein [Bacteroidia bacterium]
MRKGLYILFLFVIFIAFNSCKHNTSAPPDCPKQTFYITPFLKQFEFKNGSYWIYTSPNSIQIDTMKVVSIEGGLWNYPYCNDAHSNTCVGNNNQCLQYEDYHVTLKNRSFDGGNSLGLDINGGYIFNLVVGANYNESKPRLLVTSLKDSLRASGYFSKLECILDTLTVSGTKYNNVYQMYFSISYFKFQRIWWCAGVGFIKFEYINPMSQVETWYLNNYHVIL